MTQSMMLAGKEDNLCLILASSLTPKKDGAMKIKPKGSKPHEKQVNCKTAYWCDHNERWTFQKGNKTATCRGRL